MKTVLIVISMLVILLSSHAQQDTLTFYSSKSLNQYRFANTYLNEVTNGYLLDLEEEWTSDDIDSFFIFQQKDTLDVGFALSFMNLMERTDVRYQFERDSILFPILDHYMSSRDDKRLEVPLLIMDIEFHRLIPPKREIIDNWTGQEYPQFSVNDFTSTRSQCVSFFSDSIYHNDISIYWDESTFFNNTSTTIAKVNVSFGAEWIEIQKGEFFDIMPFIGNGTSTINIEIQLSDSTVFQKTCRLNVQNRERPKSREIVDRLHLVHWDNLDLFASIYYGCEDRILDKPFILVAGWGPYTDKPFINTAQEWPSEEDELYHLWNQADILGNLRSVGYDVIIARFLPPNADIRKNVVLLEELINHINTVKMSNGSYEENIILGYSAGAMAVRLTLQTMEHRHLNFEGPHPHTKLYISYDGEHQGANIPLATQHTVKYMDEYLYPAYNTHVLNNLITNTGYTMYTLNYILNAPLSKQLLKYFHTETGTQSSPAQGEHYLRTHYLWEHIYKNHAKNEHIPFYPSFTRNISISNGMNESNIMGNNSQHYPFPNQEGFTPFRQELLRRKWNSWFNKSGGNLVFQYRWKPLFTAWQVKMEGATNWDCLVLDNAPGGTVFIPQGQNPLYNVVNLLRQAIAFSNYAPLPQDYRPHTQFSFTPTLLTHDIRNFDPATTGYRMDYSLKQNKLMFETKQNHDLYILNPQIDTLFSEFWGYPHLAYPHSHYWEVTPFDALFTWNENTEHILFNRAVRNDPDNYMVPWERLYTNTSNVVKNFLMDEADYYNAFIQNKRYGWNARDNYVYKAAIIVPNVIRVGEEVTQRTNFRRAEFLPNSDLYLQAGEEIVFYPGTEINVGAVFQAKIAPYHCGFTGMTTGGTNTSGQATSERISVSSEETGNEEEETIPYIIYPNPSDGEVNIRNLHPEKVGFEYIIYDLSGNELTRGESREAITTFRVATGMYIVKLNNHEKSYSYKVIVR